MPEFFHVAIHEAPRVIEVGALLFGIYYVAREFHENARSRQLQNLIHITEGYRELWGQLYANPDLARVLSPKLNLAKHGVMVPEDRFVRSLVGHLYLAFRASEVGSLLSRENLRDDVAEFFSLPIPNAVWMRVRTYYPKEFAVFVDSALLEI